MSERTTERCLATVLTIAAPNLVSWCFHETPLAHFLSGLMQSVTVSDHHHHHACCAGLEKERDDLAKKLQSTQAELAKEKEHPTSVSPSLAYR